MFRARPAGVLVFALFSLSLTAFSQGITSLRGTVTDQSGAAISDAAVTLTQTETGLTRSALSKAQGAYEFAAIPPGSYKISVKKPGFASFEQVGLKLLVDTPATSDVQLELATNRQTVTVEEAAPELNRVDASVGNAFQQRQVQDLPIQTRNAVQLLSLQPGVTQNGEVMGARRDQNNITLDGVDVNDNQNSLSGQNGNNQGGTPSPTGGTNAAPAIGFNSALPVPLDSVQEFRVTVAGAGGSAGHSSGGQVSLITRSGTNRFHGSAYEFNRNTAYTANSFFNNRVGADRPQLVRNQFGASLGGPIKKDRLFFFLNYERRIDSSQTPQSRVVPSQTLKQGLVRFRTSDNAVQTLNPSQIRQIDPTGAGINPYTLNYLQQFPTGNDPSVSGADGNLNFNGFRFNAPVKVDYRTYVGNFTWNVDAAGKHSVSFRGTLSNFQQTLTPAQYPGQTSAQDLFSNNRGFAARYTAVLSPTLVNVANFGLTRIGFQNSGPAGPSLTFGPINPTSNFSNRALARVNPVYNITDNLTWTKSNHTVNGGANLLLVDNTLSNYQNSYPTYSFSRGVLLGLGNDIYPSALAAAAGANTSLTLNNPTAVTNGLGVLYGLINSTNVTYQFQTNGSALALGLPQNTNFLTRNYEAYIQDTWKVNPKLTVTYGLHYQVSTPPYESSGLQVGSNPGIDTYFANRVYAQANGIPANQLPNGGRISYALNGPVNNQASWYRRDSNNWAPRLSIAYAPGKSTVIRAGAAMLYDAYGNDLVANFARLGSVGLSSTLSNPTSYNFTTSPRITTAGGLPALPAVPAGGFPYTPPDVRGITTTLYGISPDLVAPYSYVFNFNVSQQVKGFQVEAGYVGRLAHKSLLQVDTSTPLIYFKDPKSGQTWVQNDSAMRSLYNNGAGVTPAQVKANPGLVPTSAFVENMFPNLANAYIPGSASANYYFGIFDRNAGSSLDNLHQLDRVNSASRPNCYTVTGCFTFFAPQSSATPSWFNAGNASYHAMLLTVRRPLTKGFGFDFNYTWSHAIDNASTAASNAGQFGGVLQNAFLPGQSRGDSDYDIRQQFNANLVYELPVGKGKRYLESAPMWLDTITGGWQVASLIRVQSGLPSTIAGNGVFNTNYWQSSLAIPNGVVPTTGSATLDQTGAPNLFTSTTAAQLFQDAYPGQSGQRGIVRMPWQRNVDVSVMKAFALGHGDYRPTLTFRAEAFNVFNNTSFQTVNLVLSNPDTFGRFQSTADARVLQLALRVTF